MRQTPSPIEESMLAAIEEFLRVEMNCQQFCFQFTDLWIKRRDASSSVKETWPEPYDEILVQALLRGKISKEEFRKSYDELWGLSDTPDLGEMLDAIHSSCSALRRVPELHWQIDEDRLRAEVREYLLTYQARVALARSPSDSFSPDPGGET